MDATGEVELPKPSVKFNHYVMVAKDDQSVD